MRPLMLFILLLGCTALQAQQVYRDGFETRPSKPGLGINLESVVDFAAAYPFTDLFKQSRPWITAAPNGCTPPAIQGASCFDTLEASQLDLDSDGWVRSLPACGGTTPVFCIARTVINSSGTPYPNGNYLVLYDGQGTLSYSGGASRIAAQSTPGRDVVAVNGSQLWILDITSTAAAPNHVRNIRVLAPGFDPATASVPRFHPDFVAELAPYRSLRFMDWMETNGGGFSGEPNTQQAFADRPLPGDAHWSRDGVPLEVMIELANVTGGEPWFTLPHRANDAYVSAFAALVRDQLAAGRTLYVEYSNEVWNSAFPQGGEIEDRGDTLYGALGDPFIRRLNAHGQRTAEICALFKAAFGSQASRVVCVLGAQAANTFTQTQAADCPLAVQVGQRQTPCHTAIDAVAIAPYFGNYTNIPANQDEVQLWSLDDLFTDLSSSGRLFDTPQFDSFNQPSNVLTPCLDQNPRILSVPCPIPALDEVLPWISGHRDAAVARGLRLLAYEGGQHYVGVFGVENNAAITQLFVAANRDSRMQAAYQRYLQSWKDGGGELFSVFALTFPYGRFGSWGVLESLQQTPRPPKAQAILDFNASNPCWWPGCND